MDRIPASRLYELAKIMSVPLPYFYEGLDGQTQLLTQEQILDNLKGKKITLKLLDLQAVITDISVT